MNNQILKSNSAFVVIGDSPAWKTSSETGRLFPLVQNFAFDISLNKQKSRQLGSKNYCINNLISSPEVNLKLDYYLSSNLTNELLLGFNCKSPEDFPVFDSLYNINNNFYVIVDNNELKDGLDEIRRSDVANINFSGFNVLSFGNCYLTKYSINFLINQIPKTSVEFKSSNVKFESLSGNIINIPSVNPLNGSSDNAGSFNLKNNILNINSFYSQVVKPDNVKFDLKNLQIGGVPLQTSANPILKSFDLNIDIKRVDLYGLGNNYAFDRKIQYPIDAQININASVSGFNSGFLSGILKNESGYDFDVSVYDDQVSGFYKFKNAKLNNFDYSMSINQIMDFNAQFSLEISNEGGLFMSRLLENELYWINFNSGWNSINKKWQNV